MCARERVKTPTTMLEGYRRSPADPGYACGGYIRLNTLRSGTMWPHELGWLLRVGVVPSVTEVLSAVCRTVEEVLEMRESWKATLIHTGGRDHTIN